MQINKKIEKIYTRSLKEYHKLQKLLKDTSKGVVPKGDDFEQPLGNISDLIRFYEQMITHNWKKAWDMTQDMDSSVTYCIPNLIWNYLEDLAKGFKLNKITVKIKKGKILS